jgi:hypothetical protein
MLYWVWVLAILSLYCVMFLSSVNFLGIRHPLAVGLQKAFVAVFSARYLF